MRAPEMNLASYRRGFKVDVWLAVLGA